jgi:hypothetical protein
MHPQISTGVIADDLPSGGSLSTAREKIPMIEENG